MVVLVLYRDMVYEVVYVEMKVDGSIAKMKEMKTDVIHSPCLL
jgi:hypothetical protein